MSFRLLSLSSLKRRARWLEWCPTMDLVAVVGEPERRGPDADTSCVVGLYRLSWEQVWEKRWGGAGEGDVTVLAWNTTGHEFALGFSSGAIKIISTSQGTLLKSFLPSEQASPIRNLSWSAESVRKDPGRRRCPDNSLECLLPRLSKLPAKAGGPYSELECDWDQVVDLGGTSSIHHPSQRLETDVLVACDCTGRVSLYLYGRLALGAYHLEDAPGTLQVAVCHPHLTGIYISHPYSMTAVRSPLLDTKALGDLRILACTQMLLEAQIDYLASAVKAMTSDISVIKPCTLGTLSTLEDAVRRQGSKRSPFEELLYLLATGSATPAVSDWLLQRLGARGLSTFEATVRGAYEAYRRSIRLYLVPILERIMVQIIELNGRSRLTVNWEKFGMRSARLEPIIKSLEVMMHKAHRAEESARVHVRRVREFCKWLQTESSFLLRSDSVEEAAPVSIDYSPACALDYLKHNFMNQKADLGLYEGTSLEESEPKAVDYIDLARELAILDEQSHLGQGESQGNVDTLLDQAIARYDNDEPLGSSADIESQTQLHSANDRPALSLQVMVNMIRALLDEVWKGVADQCSGEYQAETKTTSIGPGKENRLDAFVDSDAGRQSQITLLQARKGQIEQHDELHLLRWSFDEAVESALEIYKLSAAALGLSAECTIELVDYHIYDASRIVILIHASAPGTSPPIDLLILRNFRDATEQDRIRSLPVDLQPYDRPRPSSAMGKDDYGYRALAVNGRPGREVVSILGSACMKVCVFDMAEDEDIDDESDLKA